MIWEKSFAEPGEMLWNTAIGSHMEAYSDGGVIISINIGSLTCGGAALIRLGSDGNLIWSKNYHGAGSGRGILARSTGELYFTGSINQGDGYKAHLTKVNPGTGEQIITRIYDFSENATYGRELADDGENIYLAGHHDGRLFLTKLTNDGEFNAEWSVFAGNGMDVPMELEIVADQIVIAGVSYTDGQKSVLAIVDFDGDLLGDYTFSNVSGSINISDIALAGTDELIFAGTFYEASSSKTMVYFGKSGFPLSSNCSFFTEEVSFDEATTIVSLPSFFESDSPVELPIEFERVTLSQFGMTDYCSLSEVIEQEAQLDYIQFYPNPANSFIQFESTFALKGYTVYDAAGKLVLQEQIKGIAFQKTVDISGLTSGVYLIGVTTENGVVHERFVKR
ncbi:MAG: T9SS type A sorting domain-containing protein [Crocinitomix sp.]|nr:T9SS type A sorting domain-containing protein [Crocinitomix sp.]